MFFVFWWDKVSCKYWNSTRSLVKAIECSSALKSPTSAECHDGAALKCRRKRGSFSFQVAEWYCCNKLLASCVFNQLVLLLMLMLNLLHRPIMSLRWSVRSLDYMYMYWKLAHPRNPIPPTMMWRHTSHHVLSSMPRLLFSSHRCVLLFYCGSRSRQDFMQRYNIKHMSVCLSVTICLWILIERKR